MLTDQKYKTRTKLLWLKVEEEHQDWPRQRKQMWVIENLQGQNCPFFKQSDKEPEPEMEPVPQPAAKQAKQKAMTIKGKIDDRQAMKLYRQGMTDSAMAEILKVTHTAMASWRQRHSLPPNGTRGGDRRHDSKAETK